MTGIENIIRQLKEQIIKSAHHDAATIRTGDYRIGLSKAIQICEAVKEIEKEQICYTKEDVIKAGEMGEINHHDTEHIVSLLDEAKQYNKTI